MSIITKESIADTIQGLENLANSGIQSVYIDMAIAGMRRLLASLEAEPYGYVHKAAYEQAGSCGLSGDHEAYRDSSTHIAVYTAPPAPVSVPDEDLLHMAASAIDDLLSNKDRSGAGVWADIPAKLRRAAMLQGAEPVTTAYKLPEETGSMLQLRNLIRQRHAEWSQATFGDVGPVGPLKHLSKEALEAAAEPEDLSEWADMQFLLWDAQRRAGISDGEITAAMEEKLKVNMARQWPEPKDGEPRLHIKAAPQQEVESQIRKGKTVAREEWELGARLTKHRFKP